MLLLNIQKVRIFISTIFIILIGFGYSYSQSTTVGVPYSGAPTTWTVPPCVTSITVTASGAEGGGSAGGNGAVVTGTITVTPGQVIQLNVGGSGGCPGAGYNGGGNGVSASSAANASCGGGGATTVSVGGVPVIIAAGGGGMGGGTSDAIGGSGGCAAGTAGTSPFGQGGGPASQSSGGSAGPPWISSGTAGTAGTAGIGGNGGFDNCYNVAPGGGGGGGYYGGGGGGSDCFSSAPYGGGSGGGGSSLVPAGGGCTMGSNNGPGSISITYNSAASASNTGPYCEDGTIQLNGFATPGSIYAWTGPNGFTSNAQNPTIPMATVANGGIYTLNVSGGGCNGTVTTDVVVIAKPTPNAGPDQFLCLGTPISLTGTVSTPGNTYQWSYIAPGIVPAPTVTYSLNANNVSPTVTVNQVGNYYFIFSEQNALCPIQRDTVLISVSDLSIATTFVEPSCGGYSDGSITVNAPGAVEYSYDGGVNWTPNSTQGGFIAGTYNVCGRTALGCQKCVNVVVTDPIPIVVSVSNDTLICQNGTGYLAASATGGNTYTYHWDFTGSLAANQSVNPIVDTYYSVYAESENGCFSTSDSIYVTVRDPLTGTITEGDTVCPTYSSDLFANVVGGIGTPYTFLWSNGDTQTGPNSHSITVTPLVTTNYTVTVTDECESAPLVMNVTVRVAPLPVPSYTVLNPYQCEPAIFDIVNTTDTIMSQYIYWLVDGEQQFFNQDTIQTAEFWGGQYDFQMIATSYEGCVDSLTFTNALNVEYVPEANFNFSPSPVTMFNTDVFMQNQSFNAVTFDWFFTDGYPLTSTQEHVQVHFPEGVTGDYEVTLIVASALGCTDTITKIVSVQPEVLIYAPNSFTPDGDAFNQTWKVVMEGIDPYNFELLIMNRWGEIVWESHDINVGWDGTFNGKPVQAGTYIWTVQTKNINDDGKVRFNGHVNILR